MKPPPPTKNSTTAYEQSEMLRQKSQKVFRDFAKGDGKVPLHKLYAESSDYEAIRRRSLNGGKKED